MHSKGPWRTAPDGVDGKLDVVDADYKPIAYDVLEDDARLIAAAPEMLEALRAVADCKFCILCQTCRNKVDAAIAKAEGKKTP